MDSSPQTKQAAPLRWWFALSWLGLDAPCVVSTWTWATNQASDIDLPWRAVAALFFVVWSIYLSDRLVDVASCRNWEQATGRLLFGRNHRVLFQACLGVCLVTLLGVLWIGLPGDVFRRGVVVGFGVGLHFLAFVKPIFFRTKLPGKEFGVGLFFALGAYACIGATIRTIPLLIFIATLVAFNCLVIAARDVESDRANDPGGASRWWHTLNRDLFWVGATFTAIAAAGAVLTRETGFYASSALAFALLTILHRTASRWSGDAVRALADFALFTPLVIVGGAKLAAAMSS